MDLRFFMATLPPFVGAVALFGIILLQRKRGKISSGEGGKAVRRQDYPVLFKLCVVFEAGVAVYLLGFGLYVLVFQ